ncbi:MAG TPA: immunoglobulin domain-containing protein [Dongiaceae bacterium]|nr:immunoglobulin domain-containing protein [Dongiaceae bacterium]
MFNSATKKGTISSKGFLFFTAVLSLVTSLNAEALTKVSQPSNTTSYEDQSVSFTVNATSNRSMRYYWYKNGTMLSIKTKTFSIPTVTMSHAATYSCMVTDGSTKFNCDPFTLTVKEKVRITKQPANQVVDAGSKASMSVIATGASPITYQWYKNGAAVSGATANTLTYDNAVAGNAGSYHVVIKNGGPSATSSTASLQVVATATTGSAKISWQAPTARADGAALAANEIAGYTLYHSDSSTGGLTKLASLTAAELSIQVDDLSVGNHYFAVTTTDSKGLQSSMSSTISVQIQ